MGHHGARLTVERGSTVERRGSTVEPRGRTVELRCGTVEGGSTVELRGGTVELRGSVEIYSKTWIISLQEDLATWQFTNSDMDAGSVEFFFFFIILLLHVI